MHHKADAGSMSIRIQKRFGRRIQAIRRGKNITQVQLAEKTGINRNYLSALENGHHEVCIVNIELLAIGLKVPMWQIFKDL